jgi:CubicO group peptidase (beta-lactamase class C family)
MLRALILAGALFVAMPALAAPLSTAEVAQVDKIVTDALAKSHAPGASVAIVRDGQIALVKAYGSQSLSPAVPATTAARYDVGSVAKQFTAAAILMLAEDGKLSLDDKVGRFLPELTDANQVTIRQVLQHVSGYSNFWTLDYLPAYMQRPTTRQAILERWGRAPLDFAPGARWDYSNTNYSIAAAIVEIAAGEPLDAYLQRRIFRPLGMASAVTFDGGLLSPNDARGYTRFALGPVRLAEPVPPGWIVGPGGLAMTARDLAKWDISVIDRSLLKPASYDAQQTEAVLTDGKGTGYGLGIGVQQIEGRRMLQHDGSSMGYLARNTIYPDDRAATVVMVNADYGAAYYEIALALRAMLFGPPPAEPTKAPAPTAAAPPEDTAQARALYAQVRAGKIDRSQLTPDADAFFTREMLADYSAGLSALPEPTSFTRLKADRIAGLDASLYELAWPDRKLIAILRLQPDGKVAEFVVFSPD